MPRTRIPLVLVLVLCLGLAPALAAASASRSIRVGGIQRTFLLHVPPSSARSSPAPLVFVLHGGGGTGRQIEPFTGFSTLADRYGFLAVYPDAVDRNWNDGRSAQSIRPQREGIDDVAFFSAMIDALSQEYAIDPKRIFATGISNGGFMSQLLAARLADRFDAIAAVAAGMAPAVAEEFRPMEPVSVLVMNGTDDPLVPYHGGNVAGNRGKTIDNAEIIRKWASYDRCADGPAIVALPDTDPSDGTRVKRTAYSRCARETEVVLYTIEGGGHTWPGGVQYLPQRIIGRVSRDINATQVIWEFFARHPRP